MNQINLNLVLHEKIGDLNTLKYILLNILLQTGSCTKPIEAQGAGGREGVPPILTDGASERICQLLSVGC